MKNLTFRFVTERIIHADNESDFDLKVKKVRKALQPKQDILVVKKIIGTVIVLEVT